MEMTVRLTIDCADPQRMVARVKATVDRLVDAVLRIKDEPDTGVYAAAMRDPEGNEFDVV